MHRIPFRDRFAALTPSTNSIPLTGRIVPNGSAKGVLATWNCRDSRHGLHTHAERAEFRIARGAVARAIAARDCIITPHSSKLTFSPLFLLFSLQLLKNFVDCH
eukprot:2398049-Rhodomonas_salina.3